MIWTREIGIGIGIVVGTVSVTVAGPPGLAVGGTTVTRLRAGVTRATTNACWCQCVGVERVSVHFVGVQGGLRTFKV